MYANYFSHISHIYLIRWLIVILVMPVSPRGRLLRHTDQFVVKNNSD